MLSRLSVSGFRNLVDLEWSPEPGTQLLLGGNGAGKTSLLESAYLVATTRSFRTTRLRDCLASSRRDSEGSRFRIVADVAALVRSRLDLSWAPAEGLSRSRDGKSTSLADYLEPLPVVVWSSRETEVLSGAPELRRRMIDGGVVSGSIDRLPVLSRFRQCLEQKKELLRRGQGGLDEWNHLFAEAAAALAACRARWVEDVGARLRATRERSGLDIPELGIEYRPSPRCALEGAEAIVERLGSLRDEERRTRRCLAGPHRDGLAILWGGSEVSEVASAGERKAFGLLLLAAQADLLADLGRAPLVLADDVDTELDRSTFGALWGVLSGRGQLFATSNRPDVWRSLGVERTWTVEDGSIRS